MDIRSKDNQAGFSLTEALVAFAVVTGGLLAVASFQAGLFNNSAYNKARTEALSLAQQKIEEFKSYADADEDNYVDENDDGVMDADGTYNDVTITGNNADFTRSWEIATTDEGKRIGVTVSWIDSANVTQSVSLASSILYLSPRSGADQVVDLKNPILDSPTGRAERADGYLSDYPSNEISMIGSPGSDGLSTYRHQDDLFLVDPQDKVLLRLRDACLSESGFCTDFVRISGTVYLDVQNLTDPVLQNRIDPETGLPIPNWEPLQASEILILPSDSGHCQRWVDSGSLSSPPTTANGDYEYFNYTCFFGGGWHGNIGFVTARGLKQTDKICQGDPISMNSWEKPTISLRRSYRGMLNQVSGSDVKYYSHGIADATTLNGQDFVFTYLLASSTTGDNCTGADAPMTRTDSAGGKLFEAMPTDFVCLNDDSNDDQVPDYLDSYNTSLFNADTYCPFDPTDPPVSSHHIVGEISVLAAGSLDLSNFEIVTSDGPNNCKIVTPFAATSGGFYAKYACTVYDWGSGWTGSVQVRSNNSDVYCPSNTADFVEIQSDLVASFGCLSKNTIEIKGSIIYADALAPISAMLITDLISGHQGVCRFEENAYSCVLPYDGDTVDFSLTVATLGVLCGATDGTTTFFGYSSDGSPYTHDIVIAGNELLCGPAVTEPVM